MQYISASFLTHGGLSIAIIKTARSVIMEQPFSKYCKYNNL